MRSLWMLLLLVVGTSCFAFAQNANQDPIENRYHLALKLIETKLYDEGIQALNEIVYLSPDSQWSDDALLAICQTHVHLASQAADIIAEASLEQVDQNPEMTERRKAFEEQYQLAVLRLNDFLERFPESDHIDEVKSLQQEILPQKTQVDARFKEARREVVLGTLLGLLGIIVFVVLYSAR